MDPASRGFCVFVIFELPLNPSYLILTKNRASPAGAGSSLRYDKLAHSFSGFFNSPLRQWKRCLLPTVEIVWVALCDPPFGGAVS
jgi:hypothetical protein